MATSSPLLVIRFSALGDVAMTVPVLRALLQQHPDCSVCMVSNRAYAPLFDGIERLTFVGADLQKEHRGFWGLVKLFRQLRQAGPYRGVADLHLVIRSVVLGILFSLAGVPVVRLDKGRAEKKRLTQRYHKQLVPLKTAFERMALVFSSLQLPISLSKQVVARSEISAPSLPKTYKVGIAPFAKHPEKTYPIQHMKALIELLQQRSDLSIWLFGGAGAEAEILSNWAQEFLGVRSMAGRYSLREELQYVGQLDAIITMDSANMHLASLCGIPVVSIWGPTHPHAGFMGWGQSNEQAVQLDLPCRPCSVFGNKPCFRGDHACMQQITPGTIVERLYSLLESTTSAKG